MSIDITNAIEETIPVKVNKKLYERDLASKPPTKPAIAKPKLPNAFTVPITLSEDKVKVVRMMDSSKRRISFQKKIGTGLTSEEFRMMMDKKLITGHVGLEELIQMISDDIGLDIDAIEKLPLKPVIADKRVETLYKTVEPGHIAGLKSIA